MQDEAELVWNYLLPPYKKIRCRPTRRACRLKAKTFTRLPCPPAKKHGTGWQRLFSGKIFSTDPYAARISATSQSAASPASGER